MNPRPLPGRFFGHRRGCDSTTAVQHLTTRFARRPAASRALRVVVVIPSLEYGARYWETWFQALRSHGFDVVVMTARPPAQPMGVPTRAVPGRLVKQATKTGDFENTAAFVSPRMIIDLLRLRPDLILAVEYSSTSVWAVIASKLARSRVVIFQEHWRSLSPGKQRFRRWLAKGADLLLANTPGAATHLSDAIGVPDTKIRELPMLVPPLRHDLTQTESSLPTTGEHPRFLYAGRLIPLKNVEVLIRAAAQLHREGHPFSVWIVGDGPLRETLEEEVRWAGLSGLITFLGTVPYEAMGSVYRRSDVYVMPTFRDYRSVSVLEAMRFALPILDSRHDGNADGTIQHGVNGLIFDPYSPDDLADCMRQLIVDPARRAAMGRESLRAIAGKTPHAAAVQFRRFAEELTR